MKDNIIGPFSNNMSRTLPWQQFDCNDGFDGDVGQDRTPTGVRSPSAHQAINESIAFLGINRDQRWLE